MRTKSIFMICMLLFSCLLVSCNRAKEQQAEQNKIKIVASLFPLYDFAKNIGKEKAQVELLLPPGMEPHAFEPKPGDIINISRADIFIYTNPAMEPWVEDILKGVDSKDLFVVDSSKGALLKDEAGDSHEHEHGHGHGAEVDPHIWLDFSNAQKMVDNVLEGFLKKDPANKEFYIKNATEYKAKLQGLDNRFKDGLSACKKDVFIHGGHFAFGYLAHRYGMNYISAYNGFSPNAEPSPRMIAELIQKMKKHEIKHVYYEELITPRIADVVTKETGAELLMLHGAHNLTKDELDGGATFISLMEQNLKNLRTGLQCP
ncbi:MAG: zinc ABC transporter substrate-binding protein [Deltaproteobacteria bacterium]|nr:zinc ABC transporter substrate-binding protein [Deltaproteobacteria bacterium]